MKIWKHLSITNPHLASLRIDARFVVRTTVGNCSGWEFLVLDALKTAAGSENLAGSIQAATLALLQ